MTSLYRKNITLEIQLMKRSRERTGNKLTKLEFIYTIFKFPSFEVHHKYLKTNYDYRKNMGMIEKFVILR